MKLLEGKVAIVTGAGRPKGMGRATALKLAEQGATVLAYPALLQATEIKNMMAAVRNT